MPPRERRGVHVPSTVTGTRRLRKAFRELEDEPSKGIGQEVGPGLGLRGGEEHLL